MILVIITALAAVCSAAKLDKSYLPPLSAKTAGGSPGALLAPSDGSLPAGSYTNEAQGVVVDAINPGTRTSGLEPTGLGGPRPSYGSTDSKVGDAAFRGPDIGLENSGPNTRIAPGFGSFIESDKSQADKTSGSTLKFTSDVGLDNYSYGFETDNGISVGENGVAANGVQAQGGYSYTGDDGKTYSVTYTADEGGYKPQGNHLPTPPPIPEEILISLEKNAKEEAAGHVDDGSYDAQKYNNEGDYSSNGAGNNNVRPIVGGEEETSSGSYVSQTSQAYRPTSGVLVGSYNPGSAASHSSQGHGAQGLGQDSGNKQSGFGVNKDQSGSQGLGVSGGSSSIEGQFQQIGSSNSQDSNTLGSRSQETQTSFFSHSTENRFGVQATKHEGTDAHTQGSVGGSQVRTPSFHSSPGSSAYSSAVTTGSGSASAFASTGPLSAGLKNEYIPPLNTFGSTSQNKHYSKVGSDSSVGASFPAPSTAGASASVSGSQTQQYSGSQHVIPSAEPQHLANAPTAAPTLDFHIHSQPSNLPSSDSVSAYVSGNQHSFGQSNQQFNGLNTQSSSNGFPSRFGEGQQAGKPTNTIESEKPSPYSKPHGSDSSFAASVANFQPLSHHNSQIPSNSINFGASSQQPGFQSKFNSKPGQYPQTNNNIPLSSSQTQFGSTQTKFSGVQATQPTLGFGSSQRPTKVPDTELTTPFETNGSAQPASVFNYQSSNQASHSFGSSNIPVSSQTPVASISSTYTGPNDANFASNTQQPSISQQQGSDDSYYYKHPSKPFVTPSVIPSSQYSNNRQPNFPVNSLSQQGSKYPNTPTTSNTGQYQGTSSSSYNGITQAAISPFTSGFSSSLKPFASQSSQFNSKPTPSTQFGQTLSSQQTSTQFGQKPIVQSQTHFGQSSTSENSDSSQSPTQQYQGTLYQYNKPAETLPAHDHKDTSSSFGQVTSSQTNSQAKPSQILTDSRFGSQQGSSQFGSQSSFQQTQTGSNAQTSQFGQKPIVSSQTSGSNYQQFGSSGSQFGQKPIVQSQTYFGQSSTSENSDSSQSLTQQYQGTLYQYNKPAETLPAHDHKDTSSSFGQVTSSQTNSQAKPSQILTDSRFGSQQGSSQLGSQSSFQQTQTGSNAQTSQFGQKPIVSSQTSGLNYQQFGSSGSQFGQKPQITQGSSLTSNTYSQSQTSQFGNKPSGISSSGQTSLGQKPSSTTQTGSHYQQTQFGSTGSQSGSKPQTTQGSTFSSNTLSKDQTSQTSTPLGITPVYQQAQFGINSQFSQSQTSQFGKKPTPTQTGSAIQPTQFGSTGFQFGQNSQSTQNLGSVSTTSKPSFGQTPFGSSFQQTQFGPTGSQFGSKPQATQSSSFTSNTNTQSQTSQFGKKPTTTQTGSAIQPTQFGSTGFQFGQNSQSTQNLGSVSTTSKPSYGQTPFGSSFQQTQFGPTGSQFGSKPQVSQGSSFTSNTYSQSQTSQFGKKPSSTTQTGLANQSTQFGSTGFQFGQNSQSTQNSGSVSTTSKPSFGQTPFGSFFQQTQFGPTGSQFGSKPQVTQGSSFTSNTNSQSQTSQFGKKPSSTTQTGSANQSTQFGSTGFQFGQNSQSTQSSGSVSTTSKPSFGQKPFGSSFQQTPFGPSGSQFGSKPQATQGSSFTSNTYSQSQTSQFGKKPSSTTQTGSANQSTQFGSTGFQFGQNSQSTQSSGSVSTTSKPSFGQKPFGSSYQQTQFGPTGYQFGLKPQATQGSSFTSNTYSQSQSSQFGKKPSSNSQTGSAIQSTQFGSTGFQLGQSSQSTQSSGSAGSQYEQKPLSSQDIVGTGATPQNQFGQTSQSENKHSSSSSASGSSFQQSQFSSGSQFGQTSQTNQGTISQTQPEQTNQYGVKPLGSSQIGSIPSRFGQTSQINVPSSQLGQKPFQAQFGSTTGLFEQKPQAQASALASNSGSNVAPFGSVQTGQVSKYQQTSQFGVQTHGDTSAQKPLGTSLLQSGSRPQLGQASQSNVGSGLLVGQTTFDAQSQKPFGSQSTQTAYQQTQFNQGQKPFGSTQGSGFQIGQSIGEQPIQGSVQTTSGQSAQSSFGSTQAAAGYNYQKPQSVFTTQYGGQPNGPQDQKVQQTQLNFNSAIFTSQTPINGQPLKPFGISSAPGTFQQTQSTVGSSQFGAQPTKLNEINGPVIQTSYNQPSGQPFRPASTQGFQSQSSAVSSSQFGLQPTKPADITNFSGQPFQSASTQESNFESQNLVGSTPQFHVQPTQGGLISTSQSEFTDKPNVSSTTEAPSFPNRVSSNLSGKPEGLTVSTVQTPIVPIPGYEIVTPSHGFTGQGEEFGGPRDPPRFDDKTGYHY